MTKRFFYMPVETPTSVAFGGPNLDILFVSSASTVQNFRAPPAENNQLAPSSLRGQVFMITGVCAKAAAAPAKLNINYL